VLRYELDGGPQRGIDEVAEALGMTRQRALRAEAAALRELRRRTARIPAA
jgi:DNA-directed RNA polymerase sigma subunit (sigma70/sigma32)